MKALAPLLILATFAVQAQTYKCVDERGVTHYSDKPRPNCKGGEVDIRPQPPISGKAAPGKEDLGAAEREFQRRQIQRGKEDEAEARRQEAQNRRCASMRAELDRLARFQRISKVNEKGERIYMDDATREARSAQLRTEIEQRCR